MTTLHALKPEENERLHATAAAVAQRTSARFALVVVPASDHYALFPVAWAALVALAATGLLALALPGLDLREGFILEAVSFLALLGLFSLRRVRPCLVPRHTKHAAASRLAHREFAVRMVAHHAERTGVLLFVSLGERYVEILADRDIHARVSEGTWDGIVAAFVAAMKAGRTVDGLIAAVEACGTVLATHYPRA